MGDQSAAEQYIRVNHKVKNSNNDYPHELQGEIVLHGTQSEAALFFGENRMNSEHAARLLLQAMDEGRIFTGASRLAEH